MTSSALPSVFHAYDIRGLSPQEIDETFTCRLVRALITVFAPRRVLVGRDMRLTSGALEQALVNELTRYGIEVIKIGLCSTPLFYSAVSMSTEKVDLGVMVTASHNPGKYNGFKLVRGDASPIGQGSGMEELEAAFRSDSMIPPLGKGGLGGVLKPGEVLEDRAALSRYLDRVFELAALPSVMPRIKVGIDVGNGMAGHVLPDLLARCPWLEVLPLYFEPDGNFPNHEANPLKQETLHDLSELVVKEGCQFGIAFDGDADRIGFVDEMGAPVPGDLMTALLAQEVLLQKPGSRVLYDLRSSWAVSEMIQAAGGVGDMCRVGHAFIKHQMKEQGAVFAGEISMHYYFRALSNAESTDLVMLLVLKLLADKRLPFSEIWTSVQRYVHSGEINFTVQDKSTVMAHIREKYVSLASSISDIDGIRMEFRDPSNPDQDWWFSVRASNTEPLLRLNLETRTRDMTKEKIEELTRLIIL